MGTEGQRSITTWVQMKEWRLEKIEKLQKEIDEINTKIKIIEDSQKE